MSIFRYSLCIFTLTFFIACGGGGGGGSGTGGGSSVTSPVSDGGNAPSTPQAPSQPEQFFTLNIHAQNWTAPSMFVSLFGFQGEFIAEKEIKNVGKPDLNLPLTSDEKTQTSFVAISSFSIKAKDANDNGTLDAIVIKFSETSSQDMTVDEESKETAEHLQEQGLKVDSFGLRIPEGGMKDIDYVPTPKEVFLKEAIAEASKGTMTSERIDSYAENSLFNPVMPVIVRQKAMEVLLGLSQITENAVADSAIENMGMGFDYVFGKPNPWIRELYVRYPSGGGVQLYQSGLGPIVKDIYVNASQIGFSYSFNIQRTPYLQLTRDHITLYKHTQNNALHTAPLEVQGYEVKFGQTDCMGDDVCLKLINPLEVDTFYTVQIKLGSWAGEDLFSTFKTINSSQSSLDQTVYFKINKDTFKKDISDQGVRIDWEDTETYDPLREKFIFQDQEYIYYTHRIPTYNNRADVEIIPPLEYKTAFSPSYKIRLTLPLAEERIDFGILSQKLQIPVDKLKTVSNELLIEQPLEFMGMPFSLRGDSPMCSGYGGSRIACPSVFPSSVTVVASSMSEKSCLGYNEKGFYAFFKNCTNLNTSSDEYSSQVSSLSLINSKMVVTVDWQKKKADSMMPATSFTVTYRSDVLTDFQMGMLNNTLSHPKSEPALFQGPRDEDLIAEPPSEVTMSLISKAYASDSGDSLDPHDPNNFIWRTLRGKIEFASELLQPGSSQDVGFISNTGFYSIPSKVQQFNWELDHEMAGLSYQTSPSSELRTILNGIFGIESIQATLGGEDFYYRVANFMKEKPVAWKAMRALHEYYHDKIQKKAVSSEFLVTQYYVFLNYLNISVPARNQCSEAIKSFRGQVEAMWESQSSDTSIWGKIDRLSAYPAWFVVESIAAPTQNLSDPLVWLSEWNQRVSDPTLSPEERALAEVGYCADVIGTLASAMPAVRATGKMAQGAANLGREAYLSSKLGVSEGKYIVQEFTPRPSSPIRGDYVMAQTRLGHFSMESVSQESKLLKRPPLNTRVGVLAKTREIFQEAKQKLKALIGFNEFVVVTGEKQYIKHMFQRLRLSRLMTQRVPLDDAYLAELKAAGVFNPKYAGIGDPFIGVKSFMDMVGGSAEQALSKRTLLDNILGLKYETPFGVMQFGESEKLLWATPTQARNMIKGAVENLSRGLEEAKKVEIMSLTDELLAKGADAPWENLLSFLEKNNILSVQDKIAYLAELATEVHEADHAVRWAFDTVPTAMRYAAKVQPEVSVAEASVGQMVRITLKESARSGTTAVSSEIFAQNWTFVKEISAFRTEQEFIKALREDSLFSDVLDLAAHGGPTLSNKGMAALKTYPQLESVFRWIYAPKARLGLEVEMAYSEEVGVGTEARVQKILQSKSIADLSQEPHLMDIALKANQ